MNGQREQSMGGGKDIKVMGERRGYRKGMERRKQKWRERHGEMEEGRRDR